MPEPVFPSLETEIEPLPRTGVVVCGCGGKISSQMDIQRLVEQAARAEGVVFAIAEAYPCSRDGQARLGQKICELGLERVVIAGCTPRLVEKTFQRAAREAGLLPGCVEVVDIRENCVFTQGTENAGVIEKAARLIEMGVARLSAVQPARPVKMPIFPAAAVIGDTLAAFTAALELAKNHFPVGLIVPEIKNVPAWSVDVQGEAIWNKRRNEAELHPLIKIMQGGRVRTVSGRPGEYVLAVEQKHEHQEIKAGVVIVATGMHPAALDRNRWVDRAMVTNLEGFYHELNRFAREEEQNPPQDLVMILCDPERQGGCRSRVCCLAAIQQAIQLKETAPDARVTVLYRELNLGSEAGRSALSHARELGVTFFRYSRDAPPVVSERGVEIPDSRSGEGIKITADRVVMATPFEVNDHADALAALLGLPQDRRGAMLEPRIRLRPERHIDDGIFVTGGAHHPVDLAEDLTQAYVTSARAIHYLKQKELLLEAPTALVDERVCTGCAECVPSCPVEAIHMVRGERFLSVAKVEGLRCLGCGSCLVTCPVKAISLPGAEDEAILRQIDAALERPVPRGEVSILVMACEWSAWAAAEVAGAQHRSYPPGVSVIRMNCSARFDPDHVVWALLNGADGVLLGACPPGECHYGDGNRHARDRIDGLKRQLAERGVDPHRVELVYMMGDEPVNFVNAVRQMSDRLVKTGSARARQVVGADKTMK